MKFKLRFSSETVALLMFTLVTATPSHAADLKAGVKLFNSECSECHTMKEGKNKKGPSIYGVLGRKAATISDYDYSNAIRASNIFWTEDKLDEYITNPSKVVPGGKMKYEGLRDASKREDLIKYLKFFSE
jgi:cytochrome c